LDKKRYRKPIAQFNKKHVKLDGARTKKPEELQKKDKSTHFTLKKTHTPKKRNTKPRTKNVQKLKITKKLYSGDKP